MCQVVRRSVWGHGVRAGCTLFHRRSTSRRCTRRGPTSARVGPAGMQLTAGAVGPASAGRHATLNRAWNSIVVFFIGGITPVAEPPCSGTLGPGCASNVGSRATVLNGFCIAQWRLQPLDATTVRAARHRARPAGALGGKAPDGFYPWPNGATKILPRSHRHLIVIAAMEALAPGSPGPGPGSPGPAPGSPGPGPAS